MRAIVLHDRAALFHGDCSQLGEVLEDNSIDAIITDPPAGIGFMCKGWDSDKGGRDAWIAWLAEALAPAFRALKPGGYALVWALPRTSHWTAFALERAGFEICDRVSHLFGTGFPKSINVGRQVDMAVCEAPGRHFDKNLPAAAKRQPDDHLCAQDEQGDSLRGSGSALKPACEDWWLVQKPFRGTYAANVLEHGTGGLNIDACRIGTDDVIAPVFSGRKGQGEGQLYGASGRYLSNVSDLGRWPAHVVLDESAAAVLDAQSGAAGGKDKRKIAADARGKRSGGFADVGADSGSDTPNGPIYSDAGGPSRFFYVAKAPRAEKEAGLDHLPKRSGGEATDREDGSKGLENPRAGAGRTGGARNFHPTVKSIALMTWLIRLITPPGGVVLDPFAGSGTTLVAALGAGFDCIGCEAGGEDGEYIPIIEGRVRAALESNPRHPAPPPPRAGASTSHSGSQPEQKSFQALSPKRSRPSSTRT